MGIVQRIKNFFKLGEMPSVEAPFVMPTSQQIERTVLEILSDRGSMRRELLEARVMARLSGGDVGGQQHALLFNQMVYALQRMRQNRFITLMKGRMLPTDKTPPEIYVLSKYEGEFKERT